MPNSRETVEYVLIRYAIRRKDKVTARNLILNYVNININKCDVRGDTLLHWTIIKFKDVDIMTMLLDRGANVHAKNHNHEKPLDVAIQNNRTEAAILLIERGALVGEDVNALLLETIEQNNHTIVENLIYNAMQYDLSVDLKIPFNIAISRGDSKTIEQIISHCRFLETSDKYIPRKLVIKSKYKDCVELLLKWNFTVNPTNNQDKYFVYGAVENGHLQIVLQLLKLGIDVNLMNSKTGLNLLKVACSNKHHEIVENLLRNNARINETISTNIEILKNPFYLYFKKPKFSSSRSSIHHKNGLWSITCLQIAVLNSDPMMTELLLRYGAKIISDPTFFNITCIAVKNNCEEIVHIFLDQGVDVNGIDPEGKSLLHFCVFSSCDGQDSKYNMAKLLLEKGATIPIHMPGNTLLLEAVTNGHRRTAQLFLDYNANIQYISPDGDTPLHKAIENDFDIEFIKTLLKLNAPVDAVNSNMLTPLHFACKHKSDMTASIIKLLLEHDANIEAVDRKGWTPLFIACSSSNDVAVKCLLDHHANANRTDLENLTPLYIAVQYYDNNSDVVKILLEHKVSVHCINQWGKSIIHVIVENDHTKLIKDFARTQINFNSINKEGDTPLHIAIAKQSIDMTETLIKYGANVNILDKKNRTPLRNVIRHISIFRNKLANNHSYDTADYLNDTIEYEQIMEIFEMQVIKLKMVGLKVNDQNFNIVYNFNYDSDDESSDDEDIDYKINVLQLEVKCGQEIEKMRAENIGINNMTLYDFLKKNIHILSKYVKNKKIQQKLDLEVYDEKFPLYIDIIRSRFRDAKLRYRLMNAAKNYFSANINHRLSYNCIDTVFSYLNIKEIKMFIRAMKPLNEKSILYKEYDTTWNV